MSIKPISFLPDYVSELHFFFLNNARRLVSVFYDIFQGMTI